MRTTIELTATQLERLLAAAARRGEKGFSVIVGEAPDRDSMTRSLASSGSSGPWPPSARSRTWPPTGWRRSGRPARHVALTVAETDVPIAGICLDRSARLLTRNRSHLDRVDGLEVVDP